MKYADAEKLELCSAYWEKFFSAYADYDELRAVWPPLTAGQLMQHSAQLAAKAIVNGELSDTGPAYRKLITPTRNDHVASRYRGDRGETRAGVNRVTVLLACKAAADFDTRLNLGEVQIPLLTCAAVNPVIPIIAP